MRGRIRNRAAAQHGKGKRRKRISPRHASKTSDVQCECDQKPAVARIIPCVRHQAHTTRAVLDGKGVTGECLADKLCSFQLIEAKLQGRRRWVLELLILVLRRFKGISTNYTTHAIRCAHGVVCHTWLHLKRCG